MRHGESEYNVKKLINFDPSVPVHLTENGKKQAEEAAGELKHIRFDAICSSEFPRARETAEIAGEGRDLEIKIDKRLNEVKFGFEGKYYLEYIEQRNKSGDIINFKTEGGESFLDVKARVKQFLEDLKKENYARVLIVAHEAVVIAARVIFNELGDEDSLMTNVKNAEYFMFDL